MGRKRILSASADSAWTQRAEEHIKALLQDRDCMIQRALIHRLGTIFGVWYLGDVVGGGRGVEVLPLVEIRVVEDRGGVRAVLVDPVRAMRRPHADALVVVPVNVAAQASVCRLGCDRCSFHWLGFPQAVQMDSGKAKQQTEYAAFGCSPKTTSVQQSEQRGQKVG